MPARWQEGAGKRETSEMKDTRPRVREFPQSEELLQHRTVDVMDVRDILRSQGAFVRNDIPAGLVN